MNFFKKIFGKKTASLEKPVTTKQTPPKEKKVEVVKDSASSKSQTTSNSVSYDVEYYCNCGNNKAALKDYSGAIMEFSKAIEIDPNYAPAYVGRGFAQTYNQHPLLGRSDFEIANRLAPGILEEIMKNMKK